MKTFKPKLSTLPKSQRELWPELHEVGTSFVLYGGTALALRLGHRPSEDFDFFSPQPFHPDDLEQKFSFLRKGTRLQSENNTLVTTIHRHGSIKLSFFGGLQLNRIQDPEIAKDNHILVASLQDLAATKVRVIQSRAQAKDYQDIASLLKTGISLEEMLSNAQGVYGQEFNPAITLKALAYFEDGDLPTLPNSVKKLLQENAWNVRNIPKLSSPKHSILPKKSV